MATPRIMTVPDDEWSLVRRTVKPFVASRSSRLKTLCDVRVGAVDGRRVWWATDSYRAVRFVGGEVDGELPTAVSLPTAVVKTPGQVDVRVYSSSVRVRHAAGDWLRVDRTAEDRYPDIEALFQRWRTDGPYVEARADLLARALAEAAKARLRPIEPVVIVGTGGKLVVQDMRGEAAVEVARSASTDRVWFAVNPDFLTRIVSTAPGDVVQATLAPYPGPLWIETTTTGSSWSALLMPMKVRGHDGGLRLRLSLDDAA